MRRNNHLTSLDRLWVHMRVAHSPDFDTQFLPVSKRGLQLLHGQIQKRDGKCPWRA